MRVQESTPIYSCSAHLSVCHVVDLAVFADGATDHVASWEVTFATQIFKSSMLRIPVLTQRDSKPRSSEQTSSW